MIALVFYFVLRGGLLNSSNFAETGVTVSVYGVSALAVLVGMFSHEAVAKLKALAETLFSKGTPSSGDVSTAAIEPANSSTQSDRE